MISPLFLALQMLQLEHAPVLALTHPPPPSIKNKDILDHVQRVPTKMGKVLKHMLHKETLKRPEFVRPETEEAKRRTELIAVLSCLMDHYNQMEPDC